MKTHALAFLALTFSACAAPPAQPGSLWDSLPASEGDAAKTVPEVPSVNVSPEPPATDVQGAVVLNEIFYDSAESDTDGNLFVELYGSAGLPIGGCKVAFVNGSDGGVYDAIAIPFGAKIRDDGFFLIADGKTGSNSESNVSGADLIDTFDPQNGPDAVQLLDSQGTLVDAVGYGEGVFSPAQNGLSALEGSPAPDVGTGHSLERAVAGIDTDDNAADFIDQADPTPGYPNPPEFAEGDPAPPAPIDPPSEPETEPGPLAGKVVLNEIYYDSVGSDTDGVLFVELFGNAGKGVGNYKIRFMDGADGSIDGEVVLPASALLQDDGFYVVGDAKNGLSLETNVTGADFIDNFDPPNGPDAVQLFDAGGSFLDAVGYGDGLLASGQDGFALFEEAAAPDVLNGHSLERHLPGFDTDDNFSDFLDREFPTPGW